MLICRYLIQGEMLWLQSNNSLWFCQWHSRHREVLKRMVHATDNLQEAFHEPYAIGAHFSLTPAEVTAIILPIWTPMCNYYYEHTTFLGSMPYRAAQLGDSSSVRRREVAAELVEYFQQQEGSGTPAAEYDPFNLRECLPEIKVRHVCWCQNNASNRHA
jgi:hypothetical protein